MLSDREREALLQIQCSLLADDPDFAQSFGTSEQPPPRISDRHAYTNWIIGAALVLSLLSLAMSTTSSVVAFAAVALVAVARQFRDADKERNT